MARAQLAADIENEQQQLQELERKDRRLAQQPRYYLTPNMLCNDLCAPPHASARRRVARAPSRLDSCLLLWLGRARARSLRYVMCENCRVYNNEATPYWECATRLEAFVRGRMKEASIQRVAQKPS